MPDLLASISEANEYFNTRLYVDAWINLTDSEKTAALTMATRKINGISFQGAKYDETQDNAFPRCYPRKLSHRDFYREDFLPSWYCETDVPKAVKNACCEEALALLETGNSERARLQREGVQSASLGKASETYKPGAGRGLISFEAKDLLRPYMARAVPL